MIKNAIEPPQPTQKVGYNSNLIYPKSGGIDLVIRKLVEKIKIPIATDHEVVAIDPAQKLVSFANGRTLRYTQLISTMPLNHLLARTQTTSRSTAPDQARKLKCNSVLNINLGINRPIEHDIHWLYVPDPSLPFYRLGFWHNICAALAPTGHSALYAELSFMPGRDSRATVARRREAAVAGICTLLGISRDEIILEHDLLLHHAYVIYDQWRKRNITGLLRRLTLDNIHSIGRFGEWKYSSMQEAVLDGRTIAATLAAQYGALPLQHYPHPSSTDTSHERHA
jgi:protoporphyrinogen oxidase